MPGLPIHLDITRQILANHRWEIAIKAMELPPRLSAVVALVMLGKSDKQIAATLRISRHTVRTYLTRLYQRYGVADRVTLVLHIACVSSNP